MGTSPATCIVTIALEKLGIPSVYITAPPGGELVEGVAVYRAGHLCLCKIDIYQASTTEEVREQIDLKWDYIIDSLTATGKKLQETARIDFKMDKVPPGGERPSPYHRQDPGVGGETLRARLLHGRDHGVLRRRAHQRRSPHHPPTRARYEKMLAYCPWDPEETLWSTSGPSGKDVTVKDVAIAAVMAGCKPQAMPILVTAFKALYNPKYNLLQSVTTSHPGGNLVLVSGPLAQEIGLSGKQGCMGPGYPVNATVGRAVNLVIMNVSRSVPGICDLDCIASQAEFTFCFAEEPGLAQWPMINEERYNAKTTTVYVMKAEPQHDIIDFLSLDGFDLLDTITDCCTTLGSNNAYMPGPMVIALTPDHGLMLKNSGFTKDMIREHIYLRAVNDVPMVRIGGSCPCARRSSRTSTPCPSPGFPRTSKSWLSAAGAAIRASSSPGRSTVRGSSSLSSCQAARWQRVSRSSRRSRRELKGPEEGEKAQPATGEPLPSGSA